MRKLLLAALTLLPGAAMAGGYALPDSNPRDLALGQSAVANQTGPEATYQNSSQLAGQKGLSVSGSLEFLVNRTNWSDPNLGSNSINPKLNTPPALSVAYGNKLPNGMPFGVGAGFILPGGGEIDWPKGWQGAQSVQSVAQKVYLLQAGAAIQPFDFFKIGATLLYYRTTVLLTQEVNYLDHASDATLGLGGGAFSFGVSGSFQIPNIPLTIAVDYRHKGAQKLTGNAHFDNVPASLQSSLQDQGVTEYTTIPNEVFTGVAYKLNPDLTVTGSYSLERWTVYKSDDFIGDKGFQAVVPREYHNAYVFRLGFEYVHIPALPALTLRLGGFRSISPQPTDTLSPSLTDANSWNLCAGFGVDVSKLVRIDAGYDHAFLDSVTASGNALPGTYKTNVDFFSVGLTFRADL